MELYQIILSVIVILIVVYIIAGYIFPKTSQLSSMMDGTKQQTIEASSLPSNKNSQLYLFNLVLY